MICNHSWASKFNKFKKRRRVVCRSVSDKYSSGTNYRILFRVIDICILCSSPQSFGTRFHHSRSPTRPLPDDISAVPLPAFSSARRLARSSSLVRPPADFRVLDEPLAPGGKLSELPAHPLLPSDLCMCAR